MQTLKNVIFTLFVSCLVFVSFSTVQAEIYPVVGAEQSCQADFASNKCTTVEGRMVFNNLSTGNIADYHWDFGDGSTSGSGAGQVEHIYSANGTYEVTLDVKDVNGNTNRFVEIIVIGDIDGV